MSTSTRDCSWDFFKCVLMFFVIFGHFCPASATEWTPVTRIVGLFAMPSFFFISGHFQSEIQNLPAFVTKLKKTFYRVSAPLLSWGLVYVLLNLSKVCPFSELFSYSDTVNQQAVVEYFKYSPYYIAGFFWYLTTLLICIVIGSLISWCISIYRPLGIGFLMISPIAFCIVSPSFVERYNFSFVWLFYALGMLYRQFTIKLFWNSISKFQRFFFIVLSIFVAFVGTQLHPRYTFYFTPNVIGQSSLLFIIVRFALYLLAVLLAMFWMTRCFRRYSDSHWVQQLSKYGRDTLFIYCSHIVFLDTFYRPYILPHLYVEGTSWESFVTEHLIGLLVSFVVYYVLQMICIHCKKITFVSVCLMGNKV